MLWFKKQPDKAAAAQAQEQIVPADLAVPLDPVYFAQRFSSLQRHAADDGGIEPMVAALGAKQQLFGRLLDAQVLASLDAEGLEILLDTVFSARRRVFPGFMEHGMERVREAISELLHGREHVTRRMEAFSMLVPVDESGDRESRKQALKTRRAAFDFAAEILHFSQPERYPLMSRWVWDQQTQSGALREFIRGNDSMSDVRLGSAPEMYEGARVWLIAQLGEQGLYRDLPFWVDLVLAQAYTDYFRSLAEGMLSAEFGRGHMPAEHVRKFLGIDAPAKAGMSRVRRAPD